MITDRNIAIAVATQGRLASGIPASDVVSGKVYSCYPNDDVRTALKTLRHEKAHRSPVVNDSGILQGILCMNDIVIRAEEARGRREPELSYEDVMITLKAICFIQPPAFSATRL